MVYLFYYGVTLIEIAYSYFSSSMWRFVDFSQIAIFNLKLKMCPEI